jgi:hypothetical protein
MNDLTDMSIRIAYVMVLPNGTCVRKDLYDELRRQVEDALNWLPPDVPCRIEHLVTPRFWLPLRKSLRRRLGRCLAYWVASGELPLEFVDLWRVTHKRYRRRT